jgi:hypothetical protein
MVSVPSAPKKTQRSFGSHVPSIKEQKAIRLCLFPSLIEEKKGVRFCPTLDKPCHNKRSFMRLYIGRHPTWETRCIYTPGAPLKKKFVESRMELNPSQFTGVAKKLSFDD